MPHRLKQGEDKREKYLNLTEEGEKLHKKISPEIKNLQNNLLSVLIEQQKNDFRQGLFDNQIS